MVEYLSGNRIQGSSTVTSAPPQNSWKEIGRYKVTGSSRNIISVRGLNSATSGSLANKTNLMVIGRIIPAGSQDVQLKFNDPTISSTSAHYATRDSRDGAGDNEGDSSDPLTSFNMTAGHSPSKEWFFILNILNTTEEKMAVGDVVYAHNTGHGSGTPKRMEFTGKYTNSSVITSVDLKAGTNNFDVDTEVIVLGCNNDESDGGTSNPNYWQQLKTADITSASSNFESGQISSTKKNLWIQAEYDVTSTGGVGILRGGTGGTFDLGSVMATRFSHNGEGDSATTDSLQTGVSYAIVSPSSDGSSRVYVNCFIMNISGEEKLGFSKGVDMSATGGGTSPNRTEGAFKWSTTSAQLDIFKFGTADGGNINNGTMTIWGAD